MDPYYHCKKTGYLFANCPSQQATTSKKLRKKMKAMVSTWDDSETESDEKRANVYFMANREESSKVTLEPSLDDDELTMN